jgi:hypothetical protein
MFFQTAMISAVWLSGIFVIQRLGTPCLPKQFADKNLQHIPALIDGSERNIGVGT